MRSAGIDISEEEYKSQLEASVIFEGLKRDRDMALQLSREEFDAEEASVSRRTRQRGM